eukprot:4709686-Prymnesium_polylepis.1
MKRVASVFTATTVAMANGLRGSSLTAKRAPSTSGSGTGMGVAFAALAARWSGQPPTKCEMPSR